MYYKENTVIWNEPQMKVYLTNQHHSPIPIGMIMNNNCNHKIEVKEILTTFGWWQTSYLYLIYACIVMLLYFRIVIPRGKVQVHDFSENLVKTLDP